MVIAPSAEPPGQPPRQRIGRRRREQDRQRRADATGGSAGRSTPGAQHRGSDQRHGEGSHLFLAAHRDRRRRGREPEAHHAARRALEQVEAQEQPEEHVHVDIGGARVVGEHRRAREQRGRGPRRRAGREPSYRAGREPCGGQGESQCDQPRRDHQRPDADLRMPESPRVERRRRAQLAGEPEEEERRHEPRGRHQVGDGAVGREPVRTEARRHRLEHRPGSDVIDVPGIARIDAPPDRDREHQSESDPGPPRRAPRSERPRRGGLRRQAHGAAPRRAPGADGR